MVPSSAFLCQRRVTRLNRTRIRGLPLAPGLARAPSQTPRCLAPGMPPTSLLLWTGTITAPTDRETTGMVRPRMVLLAPTTSMTLTTIRARAVAAVRGGGAPWRLRRVRSLPTSSGYNAFDRHQRQLRRIWQIGVRLLVAHIGLWRCVAAFQFQVSHYRATTQ